MSVSRSYSAGPGRRVSCAAARFLSLLVLGVLISGVAAAGSITFTAPTAVPSGARYISVSSLDGSGLTWDQVLDAMGQVLTPPLLALQPFDPSAVLYGGLEDINTSTGEIALALIQDSSQTSGSAQSNVVFVDGNLYGGGNLTIGPPPFSNPSWIRLSVGLDFYVGFVSVPEPGFLWGPLCLIVGSSVRRRRR